MNNELLVEYDNGPVHVKIDDEGTKIREWDETKYGYAPKLEFPESFDCKITNVCNMGCPFCHENSTKNGKHGDLHKLYDILQRSNLPAGIEIAIGGGNPCEHPDTEWFLNIAYAKGYIVNMTMNYGHLKPKIGSDRAKILRFLKEDLIKGLGISVNETTLLEFLKDKELQEASSNIVLHIIEGFNHFDKIAMPLIEDNEWKHPKILILGAKHFGRAENMDDPNASTQEWKNKIMQFLKTFRGVVSFDNLAIKRLNMLGQLPQKIVDENYMGEDGEHTMYIDLVKQEFAKQSTSKERKPINNKTLREMYSEVYNNRKEWR